MRLRCHLWAVCLVPLLLAGCGGMGFASTPRELTEVRYYYNNLFARYDVLLEVNPAGDFTVNERKGQEANDSRQVSGHLTDAQRSTLLAAFKGWKQLKVDYPGDWTVTVQITFDDYKVQANSSEHIPSTFKTAQAALDKVLHEILPPWPASATQPATKAAG